MIPTLNCRSATHSHYIGFFCLCRQGLAEFDQPVVNAACSRSFTRAESILAVPRSILETVVHGVPQLQIMTWTNCGATAEDEEVRNILLSLMYLVSDNWFVCLHVREL